MRINSMTCALVLALGAAGPAAAAANARPAGAATAAAASPAHAAHLREIIDGIALYEVFRGQQLPPGASAYERQFAQQFLRQASEEELVRRLTPALAGIVNPRLAAQVARLVASPAVRQRELRILAGAAGGYATNAEVAELRRIDADPAMKEFQRLKPALKTAISHAIARWSEDFGSELNARAGAVLDKLETDMREARDKPFRQVEIGSVGFEPLDQVVRSVGKCKMRFAKAFDRQGKELKQTRYDEYFMAKKLANSQHLVNAYGAIDRAEWILENTLIELNAAIKEREEGLARSSFANQPKFRAQLDEGTAQLYTFAGDYGEAARGLTAQHRKVVAFMQTHLFNVSVKDDKLAFSDEEDLRQATEVFDQLVRARTRLDEVVANMEAARKALPTQSN